ncbi:hypothetical protein BGX24_007256 [Mortierella sp. AD032]|nr:hypothetical protein BGX24_007256 [Mortierella sp. AD032]
MTNVPKYKGPPTGVEITAAGRKVMDKLKNFAQKATNPTSKNDHRLSNGIAAIHIGNSRILNSVGRFVKNKPGIDDSENNEESLEQASLHQGSFHPVSVEDHEDSDDDALATTGDKITTAPSAQEVSTQPSSLEIVVRSRNPETISQSKSSEITTSSHLQAAAVHPAKAKPKLADVSKIAPPKQPIFPYNIAKPILRTDLPHPAKRFNSTSQLAFAQQLIPKKLILSPLAPGSPSTTGNEKQEQAWKLNEAEEKWMNAVGNDPMEQDHIRWLAVQSSLEFLRSSHSDAESIKEVVLLGPILENDDHRGVLSSLITQLEWGPLQNLGLLQGLVQLLQDASPGYLIDDDLVKILRVLRKQLESTFQTQGDAQKTASEHIYRLVIATSRVLDAMVEGNVEGLERVDDHKPLLAILADLKKSSDPYLKFEAAYAFQAPPICRRQ